MTGKAAARLRDLGVPSAPHHRPPRRPAVDHGGAADTAVRLGRYFVGNTPQFWLDLQSQHGIAVVERENGTGIASADAV